MKSFKQLREKTLTPAEKKKREEIAKAIEKDEPDMPMDKKMAIATAQAKKVAEGKKPVSQMTPAEKAANDKRRKEYNAYQKSKRNEGLDEGVMSDFHQMVQEKMPAAKIAKELGIDIKTVKRLMKDMKESVDLEEGKLPPHLAKFFDKKGDLKPEVLDRLKKSKKGHEFLMGKDVAPKGYGVKEEVELDEARKDASADLYFNTYSAAVQHARAQAEKKGFEVVEDDWFNQVTTGKGKPGRGKTTRHTLKLTKNGKPVRQGLSIQVYNRDTDKNTYELNFYVS